MFAVGNLTILLLYLRITSEASSLFYQASFTIHRKVAFCHHHRPYHQRSLSHLQTSSSPSPTSSINTESVVPLNTSPKTQDYNEETILKGRHKWLGGAVDPKDDSVYGIPSHSGHVICLAPPYGDSKQKEGRANASYTINYLPLPSSMASAKNDKSHQFKWLRGIIANEKLFGIPAWFNGVLSVDIRGWRKWRDANPEKRFVDLRLSEQFVSIIPLPNDSDQTLKRWMWHGAALNANKTAIYCIPSNAAHVLKVDLRSMSTSYLPIPDFSNGYTTTTADLLSLTNKWYGGILGHDNAIYGIPYAAGSVLRIDANDDTVSLIGDYGCNKYNWHGGVLANGSIYAFPAHAESVLKIDTGMGVEDRLNTLPIDRAEYDVCNVTKYKWLGGSIGADGNVYGMPSDATSILRINTVTNEVTTFGDVETTHGRESGVILEKNKWQGGVLANDGCIYAVPSNARRILRIDTRPASDISIEAHDATRISMIGNLPSIKDKWQGGFLVRNGAIYGIPENCDEILELLPPRTSEGNVFVRMMSHDHVNVVLKARNDVKLNPIASSLSLSTSKLTTASGKPLCRYALGGAARSVQSSSLPLKYRDLLYCRKESGSPFYFYYNPHKYPAFLAGVASSFTRDGGDRKDVFIASGGSDRSISGIDKRVRDALQYSGEYLDAFVLEYVCPEELTMESNDKSLTLQQRVLQTKLGSELKDAILHLRSLQADGKIRYIMASTHSHVVGAVMSNSEVQYLPAINGIMLRYNLCHKNGAETLSFPYSLQNDLPVIAFTTTRWNRLLKKDPLGDKSKIVIPPSTADCIKFALQHPAVEIVLHSARDEEELDHALSSLIECSADPNSSSWLSNEKLDAWRSYGDNERLWNENDEFDEYPEES